MSDAGAPEAPSRFLVAGPLRLDRDEELIWVGGEARRLARKPFALLLALMEGRGRIVTKDSLFGSVWQGLAVSDAVLTTAVKEVRQAIGDSARSPRFIETVHGRGYRFLPAVEEDDASASHREPKVARPAPLAGQWRPLALAAAALLVVAALAALLWLRQPEPEAPPGAHPKSIAVLPFADLSPGGGDGWFAAGLTEEISNSLGRTPDLRVAARSATTRYGERGLDIPRLGQALGVAHLLEGSIRRDGGGVRVSVQLVRAADGMQLWTQTYDRAGADVISIQEEVAFAIARSLKTVLDPGRLRRMLATGTRSVEAYEAFLRARSLERRHLLTGGVRESELALDAYEKARTLDPNFAAAHWEAAQGWFGRETRVTSAAGKRGLDEAERMARFNERVDAAIASAPNDVERLKYRAARALMDLQFLQAERLLLAFLHERPRDLDGWGELVDVSGYAGHPDQTARAAERLFTLSTEQGDPLSRAITATVMARQFPTAAERARKMLEARPEEALVRYQAHRALLWAGATREAGRLLEPIMASDLPEDSRLTAALRQACAERRLDDARNIYGKLIGSTGEPARIWLAAKIMGDDVRAEAVLRPFDDPARLRVLMQYLIYPFFDSRPFPNLQAQLDRGGVKRPLPLAIPFRCPPSPSPSA